jgi:pimeloyl-ACP methyl ester carboxylesterase
MKRKILSLGIAMILVCAIFLVLVAGSAQAVERRQLVGNIYEYTWTFSVSPYGQFDKIGVHRVVKEILPWVPIIAPRGVMMVHGDTTSFRASFLPSKVSNRVATDYSLAIFLAQNNIDVWGIDLRWTFVPDYKPGTTTPYCSTSADCTFMKKWDTNLHLGDIKTAVKFARQQRYYTGSGTGKIFMLGHSRGGMYTYAYANQETQLADPSRDLKGVILVDIAYKFDPVNANDQRRNACTRYNTLRPLYYQGIYFTHDAADLKGLAYLARYNPNGHDLDPNLTNKQVALFALTATYATATPELPSYTPYYHYLAGTFNQYGIPTGLQFANFDYILDIALSSTTPSFQSLGEQTDGEGIMCWVGSWNPAWDGHLSQIKIPVYYVGAAGGFGEYGKYTLKLLGSTDKSSLIVSVPGKTIPMNYGHVDLLWADNYYYGAISTTWVPIYNWIVAH